MFTLKTDILDKSLLRRTKENRAADMKLPPRIVTIRTVRLHPIEEDFYNALYTQTQSSFNDYVTQGTLLNNYAHIFDLLMRMRQAVDHPYLVVYSKKDMKARASNGATIANGTVDCGICHETPTDRVLSSCCEEGFCRSCVQDYMAVARDEGSSIPCPGCRAPFSIDLNQVSSEDPLATPTKQAPSEPMPSLKEMSNVATGSILRRINLAEFATSTKIEALVEELVRMRDTSPGSKAIVFSQFVNMLDLIRWRLHSDPCLREMGLGAKALHGGMDVKARDASLKNFREDPNTRVLLISLKAGGVALNLTVANHIYLMDPWWNPAAEYQAIDRTHRLGQYRPIRAVRFIAEDTVEERILQLQEKKRLVFDGTIGRDAGSLQMLTVDDMKSLFA
jgi:DNA repair protein RAD16